MSEDEKLHEEAEEIRKETAEGAPEVAEHDHVAELERQLEEAKSKALYAAAETQNVRRRLDLHYPQRHKFTLGSSRNTVIATLVLEGEPCSGS